MVKLNGPDEGDETASDVYQSPEGAPILSVDRTTLEVKGDGASDQLADGCDMLALMDRMRLEAVRSTGAFKVASQVIVALQGRMEGEPKEDYCEAHHNIAVGTANDWLETRPSVGPGWIAAMTLYECYIHAALVRVKSLVDFITDEGSEGDDDSQSGVGGGLHGYLYNIHDLAARSVTVAECADRAYSALYGAPPDEMTGIDSDVDGWLHRLHSDIEVIHESLSHISNLLDPLNAGHVIIEPDVKPSGNETSGGSSPGLTGENPDSRSKSLDDDGVNGDAR